MTTTDPALTPTAVASDAHPGTAHRTGQLIAVLRSEGIKATTVRANKIMFALAGIIGLLSAWAGAAFGAEDAQGATDAFVYPALLTAVLAAVAGVLLFTSEVQHGTLAGSLTAHPSRWPVAAAKALLAAGLGLLLGAVGLAAGFLGALAGGLEVGDGTGVASTTAWALLYTSGSALLGLGVGMMVRHSAGAVSGLLVWWLVVEGLLVQLAPPEAVRFVPFDTGFRSLGLDSDLDVAEVAAAGLSNPLHASIFWAYVIAALAAGTVLLVRRDAS